MRVLLLSQWYPPEPMRLLSDFTETLRDLGHDVTVLTGFPNWPSGRIYPGYRLRLWQREEQNGVRIVRVFLFPDHSRSAFKRALNFLSFAASATVLGPWLLRRPDVIHMVHPPITAAVPALLLSTLWRVPFTMEIQDMWPENLRATGMVHSQSVLNAIGTFAKYVYRKAAAIRVISSGFRNNLLAKRVPDSKISVVSNWVETDFYRPMEPDSGLARRFDTGGRFIVMYAGTMGLAQGLDLVLDAADILRDLPEVRFVLAGDGVEYARLRAEAESRRLANVIFTGRMPGESMPSLYSIADVLFVHLRDDPLFEITIPHKIYTYMAAGKMVLAAMKGDAETLVETSECGVVCAPEDAQALADTVRRCAVMTREERARLGENGRRAVLQHYTRPHLVGEIERMLKDALYGKESGGRTVSVSGSSVN